MWNYARAMPWWPTTLSRIYVATLASPQLPTKNTALSLIYYQHLHISATIELQLSGAICESESCNGWLESIILAETSACGI